MNNNNNRNNRRRGRGNRNQGGNGAQLNRIDSRARGNAPQMLDKYKKLAQDAHHNGDRVQMEYYLQFADHYFRVIADNKARVDEQRGGAGSNGRRNDERDQAEEYGDDDVDFGSVRRNDQSTRSRYEQQDNVARNDAGEGEAGQEGESFLSTGRDDGRSDDRDSERGEQQARQPSARRQPRKPRDAARDGGRENGRENGREGGRDDTRSDRAPRAPRKDRPERSDTPRADTPAEPRTDSEQPAPKPARVRKPRKVADNDGERAGNQGGIDSSILPPSIRGGDDTGGEGGGALETVE
ncbi:DUF4167 domain-containing protein [Erythrobacter sp. R86502]|uniref:DUF4167 domain-containing protein n=1 Tax=Erythrobacter sp. R86502 TaxID=3093846 RepID=UPI0036D3E87B